MAHLTSGKLARQAGVGVETIRFYEREGLIDAPPRGESGYRQFPEETVSQIRFIKRAKDLGFNLSEIRELLALRIDSTTTCQEVRLRADAKINDIERKILALRKMQSALRKLTKACKNGGPLMECPILGALED